MAVVAVMAAVANGVDPKYGLEHVPNKVQGVPCGVGIEPDFGLRYGAITQIVRGMDRRTATK